MTEIMLRKRAARYAGEVGLFSTDDEGIEVFARLKNDRDVGCDVKQRRNPRHHRLVFQIIRFVGDHCALFEGRSTDEVLIALKIATRHVKTAVDVATGNVVYVPLSISFAAMDQTRFAAWFDDACRVIAERWMPAGVTAENVRDELLRLVDGDGALGRRIA